MIDRHRGRVHHGPSPLHMGRIMSGHHLRTCLRDIRCRGRIGVTSADRDPPAPSQQRQRAHSGAGYPHEVDWTGIVGG